jgi:hypothetical protein
VTYRSARMGWSGTWECVSMGREHRSRVCGVWRRVMLMLVIMMIQFRRTN